MPRFWKRGRCVPRAVGFLLLATLGFVLWAEGLLGDIGKGRGGGDLSVLDPETPVQTERHLLADPVREKQTPVILWWDPIAGLRDQVITCGNLTCNMTTDRTRWGEQDVMMLSFYGPALSRHELPVPRRSTDLWALYHDESPKNLDYLFSHRDVMNLFNYSATFRRTSHYPFPSQWLLDASDITNTDYVVPVKEKSRLRRVEKLAPVVYVQSDCRVPSDRDKFVTMLQKHVTVDSYGPCLNNRKFPKSALSFDEEGMSAMTSGEFFRFLSQYKFAIAIENAVCPDYITEKFWRPIHLGVVPIVFGSSTIKDFLPSNQSALLVDDFNSVEALGAAIRFYDENDAEYEKLRTHKHTGHVSNPVLLKHLKERPNSSSRNFRSAILDGYHCYLCGRLHEAVTSDSLGKPLPRSVASQDHFGCPRPGTFNAQGQYVKDEEFWALTWEHSVSVACAMRQLYEKGIQVPEETFDTMVKDIKRDRQFRSDLCAEIR